MGKLQASKGIVFLLLLYLVSCSADNTIQISGRVNFAKDGVILFQRLYPDSVLTIDTLSLINNQYLLFETKVDTPDFYSIDFFGAQRVNLILSESDIEFEVDGNDPFGKGRIYGSMEHDLLWGFREYQDSINNTQTEVDIKFKIRQAIIEKDTIKLISERNRQVDWSKTKNELYLEFWEQAPVTLAHLQAFTVVKDTAFIRETLKQLVEKYPTSTQVNHWYSMYFITE